MGQKLDSQKSLGDSKVREDLEALAERLAVEDEVQGNFSTLFLFARRDSDKQRLEVRSGLARSGRGLSPVQRLRHEQGE
jgi:hypothetical protein